MIGGWITPSGDYTETVVHVADILQFPEKFDLTKELIDDVYARHAEPQHSNGYPTEGRSREELIFTAFKRGWIRFRQYRSFWSVNVHAFDDPTTARLKPWIRAMVKRRLMHENDTLKIGDALTDNVREIEAHQILSKRTAASKRPVTRQRICKLSTVGEQPDIAPLLETSSNSDS